MLLVLISMLGRVKNSHYSSCFVSSNYSQISEIIESDYLLYMTVANPEKTDLRPIYTVRFCRIQPPYDPLTTRKKS